jgi:hypothetical protein
VSIPRRLGRLARGFVSNLQEEDRLRETLRIGRERGENLRGAFGAAWKGIAEEWRAAEEREAAEERTAGEQSSSSRTYSSWRRASTTFPSRKYPPHVLKAYNRLGLDTGAPLEEVNRKRRELVRRYHPDRFTDPEKRTRAERLTAEINAAHDAIERHLLRN